ncbi:hypothetical protein PVAG01_10235 [Phlyctema vagabunda]|uniref:C2H2-type domain-containing protein n=1 Tax=Phlyctema vagabunda TaxID=108571 RepID=A0ABR4P5D5_9HELO
MAKLCGTCQKEFRTTAEYNRHRKQHERPYQCSLCSYTSSLKTNLTRHMRSRHQAFDPERSLKYIRCRWPGCSTKTTRADYLRKHMGEKHKKAALPPNQQQIALDIEIERVYGDSIQEYKTLTDPTTSEIELMDAVARGDEGAVLSFISQGSNLEFNAADGHTLLSIAAKKHHESLFRILLRHTKNLNLLYDTLLKLAKHDIADEGLIQLLLDAGVDLGRGPETALFVAAQNGSVQMVRLLVQFKACWGNPSKHNYGSDTPLSIAVRQGNEKIVELLLKGIGDISSIDNRGDSLLATAARTGQATIAKLLLASGADVNHRDGCRTVLWEASTNGHAEIVKALLDHGAEVNTENFLPLAAAARQGYEGIVRLLLESGANINHEIYSPLAAAARWGNENIVRLLLEKGAPINALYAYSTALFHASMNGNSAIVKVLLDNKADVNLKGWYGTTPLYEACYGQHIAVAKILVEAGANLNIEGGLRNEFPLHAAVRKGNEELVRLLLARGAKLLKAREVGTPLNLSRKLKQSSITQILLEHEAAT